MTLIELVRKLYHREHQARAALLNIGYPPEAFPSFETAEGFWSEIFPTLDARVKDGRIKLAKVAADQHPGSSEAIEVLESLQVSVVPEQLVRRPRTARSVLGAAEPGPPPPPAAAQDDQTPARTEICPTLTLEGADLADEFLAVTRELAGDDATLLYKARKQSAVLIDDPGDVDEHLRRQVQERMREYAPDCRVEFHVYRFRPYLYRSLVVYGPDTTQYGMEDVPATVTLEDVAAEIIRVTREAAAGLEGLVRVVIDHEDAEVSKRLDPYATLHESGIRDGARLRVAPEAIAGSIAPDLRLTAVTDAVLAIRRHATQDPRFTVEGCDDEDLPGRVTVSVSRIGLALPVEAPDDGADPAPVAVLRHRIDVHFPAMFPLLAPRIVWATPVFHPNVRPTGRADFPAGTLQFRPLLSAWRTSYDCVHLARTISDVAAYREYDLAEVAESADSVAARWAATEAGQKLITEIGGRPMQDIRHHGDPRTRPPGLFLIRPLGGVSHGH